MEVDNPAMFTLGVMARTAHAAARTWTLRRYVGRLAARAGPHDYVGQLRAVYDDLVRRRWRYVMEPDEAIHGTARSLLAHVLGAEYNRGATCRDPLHCDVVATPWRDRGWGDCDDVATLVAAAALALGLRPRWRVAQLPGSLHVAVQVETPSGERVDLDPVAYPRHGVAGETPGFRWAVAGPDVLVRLVDLEEGKGGGMGGMQRTGRGSVRVSVPPSPAAAHWVAVPPDDRRGPRVLAVPGAAASVFRHGRVMDGAPGVDQFGEAWVYSANLDLWVPAGAMGRLRRRRPGLVRARRGLQRIVEGGRRILGKVLSNKWVARIVGGALQAFGVPLPLTIAMLRAAGGILSSGGIVKLVRLARRDPREALRVLAKAVTDAGQGALLKKLGGKFSGFPSRQLAAPVRIAQAGGTFYAAPVALFLGVDAVSPVDALHAAEHPHDDDLRFAGLVPLPAETGEAFAGVDVMPTPTPGNHYKVRSGDSLLKIAGQAARVGPGAARLAYAQAIAAHPSNAATLREPRNDFERDNFPGGLPSLAGRPVLYLPQLGGDAQLPAPPGAPSSPGAPGTPSSPGAPGTPPGAPPLPPSAKPEGEGSSILPLVAAAALAFLV